MAKEKVSAEGLEEGIDTSAMENETVKTGKKVKEFTEEDARLISAGVEKLKAFGVSEKMMLVLTTIVPHWPKGSDNEELKAAKAAMQEAFGGADKFKDFIDGDFQGELETILGTQKVASVLNNIKSFYARRPGSAKKTPTQKLRMDNVLYTVDKAYYESIADKPAQEKKELLLNHPSTKQVVEDVLEIL